MVSAEEALEVGGSLTAGSLSADADGRMPGLGLPASVLKQIYEITPAKLLGGPTAPTTP